MLRPHVPPPARSPAPPAATPAAAANEPEAPPAAAAREPSPHLPAPEWGLAICDVDDGRRAYGRVDDADVLAAMEAEEWVGRSVHLVAGDDGVNLVKGS